MPLLKTTPPITADPPSRGDYGIVFKLRHRNWSKLQPEQQAAILLAGAEQLETWAAQMRDEAQLITNP